MNQNEKQNTQKAQRRALWFIVILCALVLCAAVLITQMMLQRAQSNMYTEVERSLQAKVRPNATTLTLSIVNLRNQLRRLANTDLIRLYASEVNASRKDVIVLLQRAKRLDSATNKQLASPDGEEDPAVQLVQQLPLMRRLLNDFIREDAFASVSLLDSQMKEYLSTHRKPVPLTDVQQKAAAEVLESGHYQVLPVYHTTDGRLMMDILQPLFPPLYVRDSKGIPVGLILASCDITDALLTLPNTASKSLGENSRILQRKDKTMQELLFRQEITMTSLPGWFMPEKNQLPFALRTLPNGDKVYSLGLNIVGTPLLIAQEITEEAAQASFLQYREKILLTAGICLVIIFLLLGMAWWWLVGQREKAVAAELRTLYRTVNEQRQLLDSVNSTLADGIVLKDSTGKIGYANQAFADIVGHRPETLPGTYFDSVISQLTPGQTVNPHMNKVLEDGAMVTYTETLQRHGECRVFQVACSPLRAENGRVMAVVAVYRDITSMVRAQEKNQQLTYQMIKVLLRSIETVDPYLGGHSLFTAELSQILARNLNLDAIHANTVRAAANLSQIGMVQLPAELRTKAGKLSPDERVLLEKHVDYAKAVLDDIDFGFPVQEAIYQMYEKMDGSGYPQKIKGPDICIDARILSVANTFCALMRPRSYRTAMTVHDALRILSPEANQYDPEVLEALHNYLQMPESALFLQRMTSAD